MAEADGLKASLGPGVLLGGCYTAVTMNPIASGQTALAGPVTARTPGARSDATLQRSSADLNPQAAQTPTGERVQRMSAAGLAQIHALLTYSDNAAPRTGEMRGHNLDLYA